MTHYVYVYRDADDQVLYVGESNNWARRAREHMRDKPWATAIASVEIIAHSTQRDAQLDEQRRIRSERPHHNVQHNVGPNERVCAGRGPRPDHEDVEILRDVVRDLEREVETYKQTSKSLGTSADFWKLQYEYERAAHDALRADIPRVFVCEPTPRVLDPRVLAGIPATPSSAPRPSRRSILARLKRQWVFA